MGRKRKGDKVNGWINLYKPAGLGSTQAVAKVRHLLNAQKAGHAGTLDPLAEGILPIALGEATKTIPFVQDSEKTYEYTVSWGAQTTTDDSEGEIMRRSEKRPRQEDIESLLPRYSGEIEQIPPRFSALKIDGQRAYALSRKGQDVELKPRRVFIGKFQILKAADNETSFEITCSKGTYIRSLARDMGEDLGCYGHVSALKRTQVGCFTLDNAISLDTLEKMEHIARLNEALLPLQTVLDDIPALAVNEGEKARLRSGHALALIARPDFARLTAAGLGDKNPVTALALCRKEPVALVRAEGPTVKPVKVFNI